MGPAECAQKAYSGPFNMDESLQLCRQTGTTANADCAIRAYSGPYSKEESIRLCRTNPNLMMRSLNLTPLNFDKVKEIKSDEIRRQLISF
jgi:hypothetical protein